MSLKKLGGETIIYGLSSILPRLLNFLIAVPLLTKVLDDEYGIVGDLFFWTGLLIALLVFRMDTAVFRFASRAENDARGVFRRAQSFVIGSVVVVVGGLMLAAGPIADLLGYAGLEIYVYLVLGTVALDVLSAVPMARLRLQQRPWHFVLANLGNVAINLALIFWVFKWWVHGGSILGFVYEAQHRVTYYLITIIIASAFRYVYLILEGFWAQSREPEKTVLDAPPASGTGLVPPLKKMLWYSLPLTLVAVAGIINALVGPTIILRYFPGSGAEQQLAASQFNAALKLAVFLNLAITAYNYAAEPFFFRQAGNDPKTADRQIYADALRAYALMAAVACAGVLLFLPWLQYFINDEDLREGLFILPVLLAANVCFGLYSNLSIAYKLTDKTFLGGGIALLGSCVVVVVGLLGTGTYGLYAPAFGMLGCFALMSALAYAVSRKYFPVNYPLGRLALYAVLTALAVWAGSFFEGTFGELSGAGAAGAMFGRGAVFLLLCTALAALEYRWARRAFKI